LQGTCIRCFIVCSESFKSAPVQSGTI